MEPFEMIEAKPIPLTFRELMSSRIRAGGITQRLLPGTNESMLYGENIDYPQRISLAIAAENAQFLIRSEAVDHNLTEEDAARAMKERWEERVRHAVKKGYLNAVELYDRMVKVADQKLAEGKEE